MRDGMTAAAFGAAVALLSLTGCKADPPSALETHVIVAAKHHFFIGNKKEKNPVPDTSESVASGKEAFGHYCAACHGIDGQNTGVPFADRMSPAVPSLASADVQRYTDGQLKWVIDYGVRPSGMPGSKGILSDEEIWSIVRYVRHLPPPGSVGEPEMYTH
jgi:mono/diheme cytochrome c family protein